MKGAHRLILGRGITNHVAPSFSRNWISNEEDNPSAAITDNLFAAACLAFMRVQGLRVGGLGVLKFKV